MHHLIDFDGTLLSKDCFRDATISVPPIYLLPIVVLLHIFSKIGLIHLAWFKSLGYKYLYAKRRDIRYKKAVSKLSCCFYERVLEAIDNLDGDVIILSASPDFLVQDIVNSKFGSGCYCVVGSSFRNGQFVHMFGINKKHWIEKQAFSGSVHFWGDSESDLAVLPSVDFFDFFKSGVVVERLEGGKRASSHV